jgi:glycosyltransferase involved in cell wall biosynthesis
MRGRPELRLTVISPFLDRHHGTELCVIEQIERLAGKDHWEVHLYSQRVEQIQTKHPPAQTSETNQEGIFWHRISDVPGPHLLKYLWWFLANQIRRWWDRRFGKISSQLTYSPGINSLDANVIVVHIVFAEFYARVRSELTFLRLPVRSWPVMLHRKLYYRFIMALELKVYRNPRVRLIAVSSLVAKQLDSHFGRSDVTVIPNSVDTIQFNIVVREARRTESRRQFGMQEKDFVLLFIGNDWKKKGLDALLKALAMLRDLPVRLLVVGSGDEPMFRSLLDPLGSDSCVKFQKPSTDVVAFYASADVYVSPALEDAFGLPILEAMACGLPVIASVNAGASENIREGETGLLLRDPRDAPAIAERVRRLYSDVALREKIGAGAAKYVKLNCSWDQNAEQTKRVLEEALNSAR